MAKSVQATSWYRIMKGALEPYPIPVFGGLARRGVELALALTSPFLVAGAVRILAFPDPGAAPLAA